MRHRGSMVGESEGIEITGSPWRRCSCEILLLDAARHAITADVDRELLGEASIAHLRRHVPLRA